jgi:hypothetical protein
MIMRASPDAHQSRGEQSKMDDKKFPFDKEPAEGSRETIDRQLDQSHLPAGDAGGAPADTKKPDDTPGRRDG